MIEGERVLRIVVVGGCHSVPLYAIFVEHPDAVHHALPGSPSLYVMPIGIMLLLGSVDTDAYEPTLIMQELAPFGGEQDAIGLYAVADAFPTPIVLLEADCLPIEAEGFEHWFASVPSEKHVGRLLKLDVVAYILLKELGTHASPLQTLTSVGSWFP